MRNEDGSFYCFGKKIKPPQTSIHPTKTRKNTSKKTNGNHLRKAIENIAKHLEIHKGDAASAACKALFEGRLSACS